MDPPVPIPNTVVKRRSTDSTVGATPWEDRSLPGFTNPLFGAGWSSGSSSGSTRKISNLVVADKRQRKPRSAEYRGAWELILHWAAREETCARSPVKLGEAVSRVIPSQALVAAQLLEKV